MQSQDTIVRFLNIETIATLYANLLGFVYSLKTLFNQQQAQIESQTILELILGQGGAIVLAVVFLWFSWRIINYLVAKNDAVNERQEQLYKELLAMRDKEIEELKGN